MSDDLRKVSVDDDTKALVLECPSCGGRHSDLHLTEFAKPYGVYTHWYKCPNTGDPAMISLWVYKGELEEANQEICRNAIRAQQSGRWMSVFFHVEDGKVHQYMFNHHLPHADWGTAADMLKREMENQLGTTKQNPEPADVAIKPIVSMFPEGEQEANESIAASQKMENPQAEPIEDLTDLRNWVDPVQDRT